MASGSGRLTATLGLLAATGCGDARERDALSSKRLGELTSADKLSLCQRWQASNKQSFYHLAVISCTDQARLYEDSCELERSDCIAKIPRVDFDMCGSEQASARAIDLYRATFANDPYAADQAGSLDPTRTSKALEVAPACPVTVAQYQACLEALVTPTSRAAQKYTCRQGDEAVDFAQPAACNKVGSQANKCTRPKT